MVGSQFWPDCLQAARAIESQREDDFFSPLGLETDRSEAMGQISDTPSSVSFWIKSSIVAGLIRAWPKRMRISLTKQLPYPQIRLKIQKSDPIPPIGRLEIGHIQDLDPSKFLKLDGPRGKGAD